MSSVFLEGRGTYFEMVDGVYELCVDVDPCSGVCGLRVYDRCGAGVRRQTWRWIVENVLCLGRFFFWGDVGSGVGVDELSGGGWGCHEE